MLKKNSEYLSNEFYKKASVSDLVSITKFRTKDEVKFIKKLCQKTDKILDLGCGYGRITLPLAKAGYDIVGVDLSPNLIHEARQQNKKQRSNVLFDIGNMLNLPYKDQSFDKIICLWSSFNHLLTIKEQVRALDEAYRVLKPGGLVFIEMVNAEKKAIREELKIRGEGHDKRIWGENFKGTKNYVYMHSRKTLRGVCKKSNFKRFRILLINLFGLRRIVVKLHR